MAVVLAIEPDARQAGVLKRVVRERAHAEITVVDSKDAAIAAIDAHLPDLILVTALLSPRDEEELVAHLRTLEEADHLQTITIPFLATSGHGIDGEEDGFFKKAFKKKRKSESATVGCDPWAFAEQVSGYLRAAAEARAVQLAERMYQQRMAQATVYGDVAPQAASPTVYEEPATPTPVADVTHRPDPPAASPAETALEPASENAAEPVFNDPAYAFSWRSSTPEPKTTTAGGRDKKRKHHDARERDEARKRAEEQAREDARRKAEAQAREEEQRRAEEARREEVRRRAEEQAREEERLRAEARAREEEARRAEERAREEARRRAEEEAREEERLKAEARAREEERRRAEERARGEERRRAEERAREEARRLAEEEAREEARRRAEEQAREEARLKAEARAREEERRRAEERAREEARRRAEEEAREEERRKAEARAREEERRRAEERAREQERAREEERRRAEERAREEERRRAEELAREEERRRADERAREEKAHKERKARQGKKVVPLKPLKRLPPLAVWARLDEPAPASRSEDSVPEEDDLVALLGALRVPPHVLPVSYPHRPCIQRVRTAA